MWLIDHHDIIFTPTMTKRKEQKEVHREECMCLELHMQDVHIHHATQRRTKVKDGAGKIQKCVFLPLLIIAAS